MKDKNIFTKDVIIPDIVQSKADAAFSQIKATNKEESADIKSQCSTASAVETKPKKTPITYIGRAAIVIAATLAAVIGLSSLVKAPAMNVSANTFNITLQDVTLLEGKEIQVYDPTSDWNPCGINSLDTSGNLTYEFMLPISISGENIANITYSMSGADFKVNRPDALVNCKTAHSNYNRGDFPGGCDDTDSKLTSQFYSEFTVEYSKQNELSGEKSLWIVNKLNNPQLINVYMNAFYTANTEANQEYVMTTLDSIADYLLKDIELTCTVEYKDGTVESKVLYFNCHNNEDVYCSFEKPTCDESFLNQKIEIPYINVTASPETNTES